MLMDCEPLTAALKLTLPESETTSDSVTTSDDEIRGLTLAETDPDSRAELDGLLDNRTLRLSDGLDETVRTLEREAGSVKLLRSERESEKDNDKGAEYVPLKDANAEEESLERPDMDAMLVGDTL